MLQPDDPLFKLVGQRPALLEVAVVAPSTGRAPPVKATLRVGEETTTLALKGPEQLPATFDAEPGRVVHSYDGTFTALIPAAWVRPGLEIEVSAGESITRATPSVGAPNVVAMTMFDVHYFGGGVGQDYPEGWAEELAAKWPVSKLEVQRVPNLMFNTLVIPQRDGLPAARVSSTAEYMTKTGKPFDGEQAAALAWVAALKQAGGQADLTLHYVNIYGANAGGQAGGFSGVGNGTGLGILHHELGHALSLPHWGDNASYPYKGAMFGIAPPENYNETHAGPTWAFDLPSLTFIPPTVQPDNVGMAPPGTLKKDPMQGGGTGDQEPGFLLRHFSDYSVNQMRNYLEGKIVIYDGAQKAYVSWDDATATYSKVRNSNGVNYPLEPNVNVVSVMASTSMADSDVNLIYPPIGPYRGGLIRTFDPGVEADRTLAASIYCPKTTGCDYSLRITQGGATRTYMLAASGSVTDDRLARTSLGTAAINLRASDGAVTTVELLATPDAQTLGLPSNPTVLARFPAAQAGAPAGSAP